MCSYNKIVLIMQIMQRVEQPNKDKMIIVLNMWHKGLIGDDDCYHYLLGLVKKLI